MRTTLRKIRDNCPDADSWRSLLRRLGKIRADDEPLSICTVLDSIGLYDALWCLRAVEGHDREIRLYLVWCARQVRSLMKDPRSIKALDVAERFARGEAAADELTSAAHEAWMAAHEAWMAEYTLTLLPEITGMLPAGVNSNAASAAANTCSSVKGNAAMVTAMYVSTAWATSGVGTKSCDHLKSAMGKRLREVCGAGGSSDASRRTVG